MGSICSSAKPVSSVITCSSHLQLTLTSPSERPTTVTTVPRSYPDLVRLVEYLYHIPADGLVIKGRRNEEEVEIVDERSYAFLVKEGGGAQVEIVVDHREGRRVSEIMPATGISEEVNGWGILKPVPIDVEIRADDAFLSRKNSVQSATMLKDPKSYICADGHLLVFDTATKDCFKFLGRSVEETSRAVVLPNDTVMVTGGENAPGQVFKIDVVTGMAKQYPPLPHPCHSHSSILFLSSIWVIGGLSPSHTPMTSCDFYTHDSWQSGPSLSHARSHHTACVHISSIFVVGGTDEASIERMENGQWVMLGVALPFGIALPGVYVHGSETLIIAGGIRTADDLDLDEVYLLSLSTSRLSPGPLLPLPDHFLTAGISAREAGYLVGTIGTFEYEAGQWKLLN